MNGRRAHPPRGRRHAGRPFPRLLAHLGPAAPALRTREAAARPREYSLRSARTERPRPVACSTESRGDRSRRRSWFFFTAAGSGAATSRACPPRCFRSAWMRGSRSPRRTTGSRRRRRFRPRCSTGPGRFSFVRFKANELGIDPGRIAASGSSAGAGIALWVGFHDDLADPRSDDPDRPPVVAVGVPGGRRRPDLIRSSVHQGADRRPRPRAPGAASRSSASSPTPISTPPRRTSSSRKPHRFTTSRPVTPRRSCFTPSPTRRLPRRQAGAGDPPPSLRRALKARLDPLGVECILRHRDDYPAQDDPNDDMFRDMTSFFLRQFEKK